MPNAQNGVVSRYIFGHCINLKVTGMMLLEFVANWAELSSVQPEPQLAIAPAIIAAIIGAAGSIGSAAISGNASKNANKAAEDVMSNQQMKNDQWWQQKQNENYMDSAEAQAAIAKARELAREQMATARGVQAVMGGTDAGVAAAQQNANKLLADTMSGIAATSTARKDAAELQYLAQNNALVQQLIKTYENKAAQNAAAGSAAMSSLGNIGSSLITALGSK